MATLQDILADRTKYPDEREITLPDAGGQMTKITVGELRNGVIPKGDHTREVNRMQTERQSLEQQYQQALTGYQSQLQQANAILQARQQPTASSADDILSRLDSDLGDATLGPYARTLKRLASDMYDLKGKYEQANNLLQQQQQAGWLTYHQQTMQRIQDRDEQFKDPIERQKLIIYAQQNQLGNLDTAYALYTRDRDLERARTQAATDAETRFKAQQQVNTTTPVIPTGSGAPVSSPAQSTYTPSPDSRDPFEDAARQASADPDLEKIGAEFAANFGGRPVGT